MSDLSLVKTVLRLAGVGIIAIGSVFADKRKDAWRQYVGQPGPDGWRVNVIQPDPKDHGPDGFNYHDWDGDGDLDVFVNFEEGGFSRHPSRDN